MIRILFLTLFISGCTVSDYSLGDPSTQPNSSEVNMCPRLCAEDKDTKLCECEEWLQ